MKDELTEMISEINLYDVVDIQDDGDRFEIKLKYKDFEFDVELLKSSIKSMMDNSLFDAIVYLALSLHQKCIESMYGRMKERDD